jgi:hypothetical protein
MFLLMLAQSAYAGNTVIYQTGANRTGILRYTVQESWLKAKVPAGATRYVGCVESDRLGNNIPGALAFRAGYCNWATYKVVSGIRYAVFTFLNKGDALSGEYVGLVNNDNVQLRIRAFNATALLGTPKILPMTSFIGTGVSVDKTRHTVSYGGYRRSLVIGLPEADSYYRGDLYFYFQVNRATPVGGPLVPKWSLVRNIRVVYETPGWPILSYQTGSVYKLSNGDIIGVVKYIPWGNGTYTAHIVRTELGVARSGQPGLSYQKVLGGYSNLPQGQYYWGLAGGLVTFDHTTIWTPGVIGSFASREAPTVQLPFETVRGLYNTRTGTSLINQLLLSGTITRDVYDHLRQLSPLEVVKR